MALRPTLLFLAALLLTSPFAGAQSTWVGPPAGDWWESTHWSPVGVPVQGTDAVIPAGAGPVGASADVTVHNLHVGPGASVVLPAGTDLLVHGALTLEGALDVGGLLTVDNDLIASAAGASLSVGQPVELTGDGTLVSGSNALPTMRVMGGQRGLGDVIVNVLDLHAGHATVLDDAAVTVAGGLLGAGGSLSFQNLTPGLEELDVLGDVVVSPFVTIGASSANARLRCAGHWTAGSGFLLTSGWVELTGPGQVAGLDPTFVDLRLVGGERQLSTDVEVRGTLESTGGTSGGSGSWVMTGANGVLDGGPHLLEQVTVAAGSISVDDSTVGELRLTGGTTSVRDDRTLTVTGDAHLEGGVLQWLNLTAGLETLDVAGDVFESGTTAGSTSANSRLHVAGHWTGDGAFVMPAGWTLLDGAGPTTIGGSAPTFGNLELRTGARTLVSATLVVGDVNLVDGGSLDLAGQPLEARGDWTSSAADVAVTGATPIRFTGTTTLTSGANLLPPVVIDGAALNAETSRVTRLELQSGNLTVNDDETLTVEGDLDAQAGAIGFQNLTAGDETLHVRGAVTLGAPVVSATSSGNSRFRCEGDWSSDAGHVLALGWTELLGGDATLGGPAPTFVNLRLVAGDVELLADAEIRGRLEAVDGTTSGARELVFSGSNAALDGHTQHLARVTVAAGTTAVETSEVGELRLTGGTTLITDDATLTVTGDAELLGGVLGWQNLTSGVETVDVAGDVLEAGTVVGAHSANARLHCAGDWTGSGALVMPQGRTLLDGPGTTTIGGAAPTFGDLEITAGTRRLAADTRVEGDVLVTASGTLDLDGRDLEARGDWTSDAVGAQVLGVTPIRFTGTTTLSGGANLLPPVHVDGGTLNARTSRVARLEQSAGGLTVLDDATLTVDGDLVLAAGSLGFQNLTTGEELIDVLGSVVLGDTLTSSASSSQCRMRCAGDWTAGPGHLLAQGWTELHGADASLGGSGPRFVNLQLTSGDIDVQSEVAVDGTLLATGGTSSGPGAFVLAGANGQLDTGAQLVQRVRVTGGSIGAESSTVGELFVEGGTLTVRDDEILAVTGDAHLLGGTLTWQNLTGGLEVLDVDGDVFEAGTVVGGHSTNARLHCAGHWTGSGALVMPSGRTVLDGAGPTSVGGSAPTFGDLQLSGGARDLTAACVVDGAVLVDADAALDLAGQDLEVRGDWTSDAAGASVVGAGPIRFTGSTSLRTGANLLPPVSVEGATLHARTSLLAGLSMTDGVLWIDDDQTLTVAGDAALTGGALGWQNLTGGLEVLDVDGDVTCTAGIVGSSSQSRFTCAGSWASNAAFAPNSNVVIELDGVGVHELAGLAPGFDPTFTELVLRSGSYQVTGSPTLVATRLGIDPGAALFVADATLSVPATDVDVGGHLAVGTGGVLALGAGTSVDVPAGASLAVVGTPAAEAAVVGHAGGGYALTVGGDLAARHYRFAGMGAAGVVLDAAAVLAPFPDDLRDGVFGDPSGDPGSVLLDVQRSDPTEFRYVHFENPSNAGSFNVRSLAGAEITFVNATGGFAGSLFEDDPGERVTWVTDFTTISAFTATPGADQVSLAWESLNEADIDEYVLRRGPAEDGPWTEIAGVAASGPGIYALQDVAVVPGELVFYELSERLGHGVLRSLALDSAVPWSTSPPANLLRVGAGQTFADVQAAVDAAVDPVTVIAVAAGSYPAFEVRGGSGRWLRIVPDGSGPVLIDTSAGPLTVSNLGPDDRLAIESLQVGGGPSPHPALLVRRCRGAVLLDGCTLTGGTGRPGVDVDRSQRVLLQSCATSGTPALLGRRGSSVWAGQGSLPSVTLEDTSRLEAVELIPDVRLSSQAVAELLPGGLPTVSVPAFAPLGEPLDVQLTGADGQLWTLYLAFDLGWLDLVGPRFSMVGLAAAGSLSAATAIGTGRFDGGGDTLALDLLGDGGLWGLPLVLQTLVIDPTTQQGRWSRADVTLGLGAPLVP